MIAELRNQKWTIVFAVVVALLVSQLLVPFIQDLRQSRIDAEPVVKMQGEILARTSDTVTIHMWGEKIRACTFVKLNAFTIVDKVMRDANMLRVDPAPAQGNRPLGSFDMGEWMIWPTAGASKVTVFVQHDCAGRIVLTNIAEVDL